MVYEKAKSSEFYNNPGMVGHRIARETFDYAMQVYDSCVVDDLTKLFFETAVKDTDDWNYWCSVLSKRYISNVRYVMRRLGKVSFTSLLAYHNDHSSMLKDKLTWMLEILSYLYDKESYQKTYAFSYGFYGMKKEDALERLDKYIAGLMENEEKMKGFVERLYEIGEKESVSNES